MIAGGGASSLIALVLGKLTDMAFYQQDAVVVYLAPVALLGISVLHGGTIPKSIPFSTSCSGGDA